MNAVDGGNLEDLRKTVEGSQEHARRVEQLEAQLSVQAAQIAELVRGRQVVTLECPVDRPFRFGMIGDTHLGSSKERLDCLEAIYDRAVELGVRDMFHTGDVLDGQGMFPGHVYEIHKHGWAAQRDWFAEKAPYREVDREPILTHFIEGNHDTCFKKQAGVDVGGDLQKARPDWRFLGESIGRVVLTTEEGHEFRILLIHPAGGTPYAISYRPQKIIEQLSPDEKPHVLGVGHIHKMDLLPSYRNVMAVCTGTTQDQTNFMARYASAAHKGAWFFEVHWRGEETLQMRSQVEILTFY